MAADFGLVPNAAQRHAHEISPGGFGDGAAKRGFTNARRAHETQNRAFDLADTLLHGQIFQDPLFDFFQAIVVTIQDFLSQMDVLFDPRPLFPRNTNQPVQIIAHHSRLG